MEETKIITTEAPEAEVTEAPQVEEAPEENVEAPEEATEEKDTEGKEETEDGEPKLTKQEENAVRKYKGQAKKYRALLREAEAELAALKKSQTTTQDTSGRPKETDYETFMEYNDALMDWKLQQAIQGQTNQQQHQQVTQKQQAIRQQQEQLAVAQLNELARTNPDAVKVLESAGNEIGQMPPHIYEIALEMDNAPLALYALAKEGRLADVYNMRPEFAAAEFIAAQREGARLLEAKTTQPLATKAPKPMQPAKGRGAITKSLSQMSADELMKNLNIGN